MRILVFFSSSFNGKIHYPWRPLSLPQYHKVVKLETPARHHSWRRGNHPSQGISKLTQFQNKTQPTVGHEPFNPSCLRDSVILNFHSLWNTLPETNIAPENRPSQKRGLQPSIFRCYVSFREGNAHKKTEQILHIKQPTKGFDHWLQL